MITEIDPPGTLYRLGRQPDPWTPPDWAYAGEDLTFGNRFDDPRGTYRVVYASTSRLGCFLETLARFRLDIPLQASLAQIFGPDDYVPLGVVQREWRSGRAMGAALADGVFALIGTSESLSTLRSSLASTLAAFDIDDLDAAAIRSTVPRALTQSISRHVYDSGRFDGICYRSRYGDDVENWAVFEPFASIRPQAESLPVDFLDADFLAALAIHRLRLADAADSESPLEH
jgi:hypothetical protein